MSKQLPQSFTIVAPTLDDLTAVARVMQLNEIELYGKAEMSEDDLRIEWQVPDFSLATDAWVVKSPEGTVIGYASVGHLRHVRLWFDIDMHPDYRKRGIEAYLMELVEERAQKHVSQAASGLKVTLGSGASKSDSERVGFFEEYGYSHVRSFWRMGIELNEAPPVPQWAEGITVRTMAPGMERAVYEADEESFKDHWGHVPVSFEEWEHWTLTRDGQDPSLWLLAMDGEEIAGFAICKDEKANGGWVHALGVRRPWRRKGIGMALLQHAFGEFYRRGIHNIYLGVDSESLTGATRLYERAGMRVVREFKRYEKELRAGKELGAETVGV